MTVRKSLNGSWTIDVKVRMPNGSQAQIRKVSPVPTKRGALEYERQIRESVLDEGRKEEEERTPKSAKFADFSSTAREKRRALRRGMLSARGHLRLNKIGARQIESIKARRKRDGVGPKTINKAAAEAPDPWCAMVPLALGSGLRLGELRGLHWDDVDLVAARLTVRRAADDKSELYPPKSGKSRIVDRGTMTAPTRVAGKQVTR